MSPESKSASGEATATGTESANAESASEATATGTESANAESASEATATGTESANAESASEATATGTESTNAESASEATATVYRSCRTQLRLSKPPSYDKLRTESLFFSRIQPHGYHVPSNLAYIIKPAIGAPGRWYTWTFISGGSSWATTSAAMSLRNTAETCGMYVRISVDSRPHRDELQASYARAGNELCDLTNRRRLVADVKNTFRVSASFGRLQKNRRRSRKFARCSTEHRAYYGRKCRLELAN
ncbi:hypothetical protein Bbelb_278210 [Branchiostoma belcheri]|nr:hypothetical protein Bbelb_278210 [Branchiostoma belcheri]